MGRREGKLGPMRKLSGESRPERTEGRWLKKFFNNSIVQALVLVVVVVVVVVVVMVVV